MSLTGDLRKLMSLQQRTGPRDRETGNKALLVKDPMPVLTTPIYKYEETSLPDRDTSGQKHTEDTWYCPLPGKHKSTTTRRPPHVIATRMATKVFRFVFFCFNGKY